MKIDIRKTDEAIRADGYWYKIIGVHLYEKQGLCTVVIRGGEMGQNFHEVVEVMTTMDDDDWRYSVAMLPEYALHNARKYAHEQWGTEKQKEALTDGTWDKRLEGIALW